MGIEAVMEMEIMMALEILKEKEMVMEAMVLIEMVMDMVMEVIMEMGMVMEMVMEMEMVTEVMEMVMEMVTVMEMVMEMVTVMEMVMVLLPNSADSLFWMTLYGCSAVGCLLLLSSSTSSLAKPFFMASTFLALSSLLYQYQEEKTIDFSPKTEYGREAGGKDIRGLPGDGIGAGDDNGDGNCDGDGMVMVMTVVLALVVM